MKKELDNINVKLFLFRFCSWLSIVFASYYTRTERQTVQAQTKEWRLFVNGGVANTRNYNSDSQQCHCCPLLRDLTNTTMTLPHLCNYSNTYPTRCNVTQFILSENCSACFGRYRHPSSGAHTTVSTASGICQTVIATCRYSGR